MKFCQRCADGISEAAGVLQSARVQANVVECYFMAEGGDTASGQLALADYAIVPEPDCEFVTHRALREMARWFALESGGDYEDLRRLTAEVYEVVDGKREQYMKGTEP